MANDRIVINSPLTRLPPLERRYSDGARSQKSAPYQETFLTAGHG